jgi:hypothetical protein
MGEDHGREGTLLRLSIKQRYLRGAKTVADIRVTPGCRRVPSRHLDNSWFTRLGSRIGEFLSTKAHTENAELT